MKWGQLIFPSQVTVYGPQLIFRMRHCSGGIKFSLSAALSVLRSRHWIPGWPLRSFESFCRLRLEWHRHPLSEDALAPAAVACRRLKQCQLRPRTMESAWLCCLAVSNQFATCRAEGVFLSSQVRIVLHQLLLILTCYLRHGKARSFNDRGINGHTNESDWTLIFIIPQL